jgi:hypothetical protein
LFYNKDKLNFKNHYLDLFIHAYNNETEIEDKKDDDDMDIDDGEKKSKRSKKRIESEIKEEKTVKKGKKGKESKKKEEEVIDDELDDMMNAPIEESDYEVTKEDKNFVYKIIYDKLHKDDSESLPIKE